VLHEIIAAPVCWVGAAGRIEMLSKKISVKIIATSLSCPHGPDTYPKGIFCGAEHDKNSLSGQPGNAKVVPLARVARPEKLRTKSIVYAPVPCSLHEETELALRENLDLSMLYLIFPLMSVLLFSCK
jgi:hypothetical protein